MEAETSSNVEFPVIDTKPIVCKYCYKPEIKQENPGLTCESCNCFVHLSCLKRPGTPGDFACDVFFEFTCAECSENREEIFNRKRFLWVNVLLLTLHHLGVQLYGISNNGFFHYKTHICSFIDRNWVLLFGTNFKQKKNWVGTIAGALSVYNNTFFMSGSGALGESGWWRLLHSFSPAVAAHINQEVSKDKIKGRPRGHITVDKALFISKVTELGYKHLINDLTAPQQAVNEAVPFKKRRFDVELSEPSCSNQAQGVVIKEELGEDVTIEENELCPEFQDSFPDVDGLFQGFAYSSALMHPAHADDKSKWTSDSSSVQSLQQTACYDSDSHSPSRISLDQLDHLDHDPPLLPAETKKTTETRPKREEKEKQPPPRRESLFSSQPNSLELPWLNEAKTQSPGADLVPLTEYEEVQLLKKVEGALVRARRPSAAAHLHRFRAKLALRRLKRHKHLPIFDLDKAVKLLSGYATEDPRVVMNAERVLDRFQRSYLLDNLSGTVSCQQRGAALVSSGDCAPFRSPYSGVALKPYIRRDQDCAPLWLRLTDELLARTNRHVADYRPPRHATLDYSYVRPQHVAPVNALLAHFFWPGVDITEALQHPEFSCVVTYKKLVVACAFLVPDVGHNEAYISFILTRPEWRNAKIATFMLYHLLQTCTGKDVTLHVSPTNPAIFLYQKFGFKVEELIQDFYEKYYDIDYKGCRHALFLRLAR